MARLAFVGPALGRHPGWVTTQGEVLAGLFAAEGHPTAVSSDAVSPVARAAHHAVDLVRHGRGCDAIVVSVFSGKAFALADEALLLAGALRRPRVAWLHGGALPAFGRRHPRWVRRVLGRADAVVAPSAFLARWADHVVPGGGARVIPNVLALDDYHHRTRTPLRPRLLWMRTFQELYDPATAVRALVELRAGGVDASLTMAGQDKGALGSTQSLTAELGVAGHVAFPGFVSGGAKVALFDGHDVFVNTNVVDNAPVTVLEAAASGLAVVSTDVGGLPDLLADGRAASLVPPRDPAALAAAVAALLDDPDRAVRQAAEARRVAERSSWPSVRDTWLDLVAELSPR